MSKTLLSKSWTRSSVTFSLTVTQTDTYSTSGGTYGYGYRQCTFVLKATNNSSLTKLIFETESHFGLNDWNNDVTIGVGKTVTMLNKTVNIPASSVSGAFSSTSVITRGNLYNQTSEASINDYYMNWSVTPDAIDRKSQHSLSASSIKVGSSIKISITRKYASATHTLQYKLSSASSWTNIATGVGTSYTWTPPVSVLGNANSGTVQVRCIAYQGSTAINTATDKSFTLTVGTSQHSLSASSVTAGSSITINITRGYSAATHTLQYKAPSVSSWTNIATGVATSYTWTPPATIMTAAKSGTVYVRCIAYRGSIAINTATDKSFTFTIPDNATYKPSISNLALSDAGIWSGTTSYLQKFGCYLTGLSRPKATWTESAKSGATIKSRSITLNGQTATPTTNNYTGNVIANAASAVSVTALTLTDSRTLKSASSTLTGAKAIAYTAPNSGTGTNAYRSDATGTPDEEGTYLSYSFDFGRTSIPDANDVEQNTVTILMEVFIDNVLQDSVTWDEADGTTIPTNAVLSGFTLPQSKNATVKWTITDVVGTVAEYTLGVSASARILSFKEDGTGVAIGKISDSAGFEVALDTLFDGAVHLAVDENAASGIDYELFESIKALGWKNDVIE